MNFDYILLIGFGRIAEVLYAGPIAKFTNSKIIVCEVNQERNNKIKEFFPLAKIINHIDQLDIKPSENSVAINLLPGPDHFELNYKLISNGWNVFTEKPASSSKLEWEMLVKKSLENDVVIISAPINCYLENIENTIREISDNKIGEICEIQAFFVGGGPARRGYIDNSRKWFFEKESCVIRDLGPYIVSALLRIFKNLDNIIWFRNSIRSRIIVKPEGFIIPEYGNAAYGYGNIEGAIVNLCVAYRPYMNAVSSKILIFGTNGQLEVDIDEQDEKTEEKKIYQTLKLITQCIKDKKYWLKHIDLVGKTIDVINKAL